MPIVIIHGQQGTGKSRHAAACLQHYRCKRVVDEWDGKAPLTDGDMAITNLPPPYAWKRWNSAQVVAAHDAKAAISRGTP